MTETLHGTTHCTHCHLSYRPWPRGMPSSPYTALSDTWHDPHGLYPTSPLARLVPRGRYTLPHLDKSEFVRMFGWLFRGAPPEVWFDEVKPIILEVFKTVAGHSDSVGGLLSQKVDSKELEVCAFPSPSTAFYRVLLPSPAFSRLLPPPILPYPHIPAVAPSRRQ